jgi:hypothetical protein
MNAQSLLIAALGCLVVYIIRFCWMDQSND